MRAIDRDFPSIPTLITLNQAIEAGIRMSTSDIEERAFVDYVMDPPKIMLPDASATISQYKYWLNNQDTLDVMDAVAARSEVEQNVSTPYSFDVSTIMSLLKEHKARSVFDPSAGWGEVLIHLSRSLFGG